MLRRDLELEILIEAMVDEDKRVRGVVERALFRGSGNDLQTMSHRPTALRDCLRNGEVIRALYALAQEALTRPGKVWGHFREYPSGPLGYSVEQMTIFVDVLKRVSRRPGAQRQAHSQLLRGVA